MEKSKELSLVDNFRDYNIFKLKSLIFQKILAFKTLRFHIFSFDFKVNLLFFNVNSYFYNLLTLGHYFSNYLEYIDFNQNKAIFTIKSKNFLIKINNYVFFIKIIKFPYQSL